MSARYAKTVRGRDEISNRSGKLPRTARNLLLIIDGTRPGVQWTALIHGASQADIDCLVGAGMIEETRPEPSARAISGASTVEAALASLNYDQLYNLLTSQAKERLGLIKGFKLVLDVEKCGDEAALRKLAVKFVEMVRDAQGEGAARTMKMALGMNAA